MQNRLFIHIICIATIILLLVYLFLQHKILDKAYEQYGENNAKVAYITAIYGNYESSCKPFVSQSIISDFICFTDSPTIVPNGWLIDTTPYHLENPSDLDSGDQRNSIQNNKHTFNIAKYYKQAFHNIPRLQAYEVIIWVDGSLEIINPNTSLFVTDAVGQNKNVIVFEHEGRSGTLKHEVEASHGNKYTSTRWNNQDQPYQDVDEQHVNYITDGYTDAFWRASFPNQPNAGMWITCFIGFDMTKSDTVNFLDMWYIQTLQYTTQDQISFPYALWKTSTMPHSLMSERPHVETNLYIKHDHGK